MNVEKDRKKLREFYNKQANFEPTRGDESYMSHIWEEFNKMKKPLEERVCREFKEIFNETFPWIFRDENICPKAIYDAHFDNFEEKK
ncbi:MAG: hypothetical protein KKB62_02105 [Nanoarchaeota archaeon]|nr:hypothetical protein [Nanoarchaeota archaeon]